MATIISTTFRLKRGLAAKWQELNLVLDPGEPGFELDTYRLKIGDGQTAWNDLPYIGYNGTGGDGDIIVDTVLSDTSLNPIANKPVKAALDRLESLIEHYEFGDEFIVTETNGIKTISIDLEALASLLPQVDTDKFATKEEVLELAQAVQKLAAALAQVKVPNKVSELENDAGYLTEHQDLSEYAKTATVVQQKYEVLPIEGMLVLYGDNEVRLNTTRVQPAFQNVGATGNANMYYATFRAYAPEGATRVIEGQNDKMDTEFSTLAVDKYGRKYTTIWAAIANTSDGGNTWTKWGDSSTINKYLGFYYNFHWYNEDVLIGTDKVRVLLTNDDCHNDLVPDAVARRIDEKVASIEIPSVEGLATEEYVNTVISNIKPAEAELYKVDFNTPDYAKAVEAYNKGKVLVLINAAPDTNSYAIMNYVSEKYITFTKFLTSRSETYGSFNTYYLSPANTWEVSKEVKLNKVEAIVDSNNNINGLTVGKNTYSFDNFATTEVVNELSQNLENNYVSNETLEQKNYVTEQYVINNYVTQEAVSEIVEAEVNEVVSETVETIIQEKIEAGELTVSAEAIKYDTWD